MRFAAFSGFLELMGLLLWGLLTILWQPCKWIRSEWRINWMKSANYIYNPRMQKFVDADRTNDEWDNKKNNKSI